MLKKSIKKLLTRLIILVLALIAVGGPLLYLTGLNSKSASAAWYDDNWAYRQSFNLTNNTGSAITNAQVSFSLNTGTLISTGKMQSSCQDLRIVDNNLKVLSTYWIEYCDTTSGHSSVIWVTVPSLPTGTTQYFVYYGNPSVSSVSTTPGSYPTGINTGTGTDGAVTFSSNTTIDATNSISGRSCADGGDAVNYSVTSSVAASATTVTLSSTPSAGCLAAGDEIIIINTQGTSGDNANVGKYDVRRISSIATATLTLSFPLVNAYDGTTQKIMVQRIPNYTNVTVNGSTTLTATAWNGTKNGVLAFRSNGTTTVTGTISAAGIGYAGGSSAGAGGKTYNGTGGVGGAQFLNGASGQGGGGGAGGGNGTATGSSGTTGGGGGGGGAANYPAGGGGGAYADIGNGGQGGNSGSNGSNGSNGSGTSGGNGSGTGNPTAGGGGGGGTYGSSSLSSLYFGSGGGAGGAGTGSGGAGGNGGGVILIGANTLTVTGSITATGNNGSVPAGCSAQLGNGGGGGGAGGSVLLNAGTATLGSSLVSAAAGSGATAVCNQAGSGGNGGTGRIVTNYSTVSGSTNPAATTSTLPTSGTVATEEAAPGPIAYWKFDEGQGATANNSIANSNLANLQGTITAATWQTEDQCVAGRCLYFNGTTAKVAVSGTAGNTQSISFWVKPNSFITTTPLVQLTSSAYIYANASGVLSSSGITSPTYYVNGVAGATTLTANQWNFVTVTVATANAISANAIVFANQSTNWLTGFMDDVKIYPYARSAAQILTDYNSRGAISGSSASLGANPQNNAASLSNGLMGYWKMDESASPATDYSGNGNTGTWTSGPTRTAGKFGNAILLSPNQYLVKTSPSLPTGTSNVTVSAWIYPTAYSDTTYNGIVSWGARTCTGNSFLFSIQNTGRLSMATYCNDIVPTTGTAATLNAWNHVVVTMNGDTVIFYLNGVQVATGTLASGHSISAGTLNIGCTDNPGRCFTGKIDDVRIYNRALSAGEVNTLYNFSPEPGPIVYYDFNESTGGSANDKSGNGVTGTWQGTLGNQWRPGKYGGAGNFNGSDNDVSTATNPITTTDSVTFGGWVKPDSGGSGSVFSRGADGSGNGWSMSLYAQGGSAAQAAVVTTSGGAAQFTATGTTTLVAGTWYHITGVWTAGSSISVYVNGVQEGTTTTATTSLRTSTVNLLIGKTNTTFYKGLIDDFKVYNYARTQQQIVQDMNGGHPPPGSPVGSAVGYWKFDEGQGTVANNSGNGGSSLNGTLTSMASPASATSGWTSSGKFAKALLFDGSDDYVSVPNKTAIQPLSGDWAVSFWMYRTGAGAGDYPQIIGSRPWTAAADKGWSVVWDSSLNKICSHFADGSVGFDVNSGNTCSSSSSTLNTWEYWTVVFDKTNSKLYYYKNGRLDASLSPTGGFPTGSINQTNNLYMGRDIDGGNSRKLAGSLDEIKIYNYALSASQVLIDMNRGQAQVFGALSQNNNTTDQPQASSQEYCIPGDTATSCAGPVARWDFEEGTGNSVNDKSGNANTGTWNGTLGSQWKPGKVGSGANLDGSTNYIQITDSTSLSLGGGTASFFAWVKPTNVSATQTIIRKEDTDYVLALVGSKVWCELSNQSFLVNAGTALTNNTWNYVGCTFDGTTLTSYLNGVAQGTDSTGVFGADSNGVLSLGTRQTGGLNQQFSGLIDQVKIFNYARSGAQVTWDYNRGGPIGWWKFDDCQGTVLHDSSADANGASNGKNGTWSGGGGSQTTVGTCTDGTNTTAWSNGKSGKFNSSLNLDGTDDTVTLPNDGYFPTDNFTFSIWAKPASVSGVHGLWEYGRTGGSGRIDLRSNGSQWEAFAYLTSNTITGGTAAVGQWSNIVLVKNGTTDKLYVNGVQVASTTNLNPNINGGVGDLVHVIGQAEGVFFSGQVDEAKFYRYVLTSTQIQALYNQGEAVRFGPLTGSP